MKFGRSEVHPLSVRGAAPSVTPRSFPALSQITQLRSCMQVKRTASVCPALQVHLAKLRVGVPRGAPESSGLCGWLPAAWAREAGASRSCASARGCCAA
eukprot:scaffold7601_cov267-Pinguiococcus_pyrenoidosus.AAC.8